MKKIIYIFSLFFSLNIGFSQYLSFFNFDTSNHPDVKGKFRFIDSNYIQINNYNINDFELYENGIQRQIQSVNCLDLQKENLSITFVIDHSSSIAQLNKNGTSYKIVDFILSVLNDKTECAVTYFDNINVLIQDFTSDKNLIRKKISEPIVMEGGTNYDCALYNPKSGGLLVSKNGIYKKVLILLTDMGAGKPTNQDAIINYAKNNNISIVVLTTTDFVTDFVKEWCDKTIGFYLVNVERKFEEFKRNFTTNLLNYQNIPPCEITWKSEQYCSKEIINVDLKYKNLKSSNSYLLPYKSIKSPRFNPEKIIISDCKKDIKRDTTFRISAITNDIEVSDITLSNNKFSTNIKNFKLLKGQYIDIDISFLSNIETKQICKINFANNLGCDLNYFIEAKFKNSIDKDLSVVFPNKNEKFVVGSDTVIKWTGIEETKKVKLEYSFNNGKNWDLIKDSASKLNFNWKKIPNTPSDSCLFKATFNDNKKMPALKWLKRYGGSKVEWNEGLIQTNDDNYLLYSSSGSKDGDIKSKIVKDKDDSDIWLVKFDIDGNIIWEKSFGGTGSDGCRKVIQTVDNGFLLSGLTGSDELKKYKNYQKTDCMIIKTDANGNVEWLRTFGGTGNDDLYDAKEAIDGGYIFLGSSYSKNGEINDHHGDTTKSDIWIVKTDLNGLIQWSKSIGGTNFDTPVFIEISNDNNYIIGGIVYSKDGNIKPNINPRDFWIMKMSPTGDDIWQKSYGGSNDDFLYSGIIDKQDNIILYGESYSNDGIFKKHYGPIDSPDLVVMKLDPNGNIKWNKNFGGSKTDKCGNIIQSLDEGFVMSSHTNSKDGDVVLKNDGDGHYDIWIFKIDTNGAFQWGKTFGGYKDEDFTYIISSSENGYIFSGNTNSEDGDLPNSKGQTDVFIGKLDVDESNFYQTDISDSLWSIVQPEITSNNNSMLDIKECYVGFSKDSTFVSIIKNTGNYDCRIDSVYFTDNDFTCFKSINSQFPRILNSGEELNVKVVFTPNSIGIKNAIMNIVTQFNIIKLNIKGEGIEPLYQYKNNFIDFGKVFSGDYKDTIQIVTLKNSRNSILEINKILLNNVNNIDFEILSPSNNLKLNPYEELKMDLRFHPFTVNKFSTFVEIYFLNENSPAKIQLYGEGIPKGATVKTQFNEFDTLICENSTSEIFIIENTGDERLIINDVKITGDNADEFSSNIKNDTINGRSKKEYQISFNPKSNGLKKANIEIVSNSKENSKLIIPILGFKENYKISFNPDFLNLGFISLNKYLDSSITIINLGNINTGIKINKNITLNIPDTSFTLASNSQVKIKLHYNGSNIPIKIDEFVTITDTYCNKSYDIRIVGEVVDGASGEFVLDTISGKVNDEIELTVKILKGQNIAENGIKFIKFKLTFNKTMLYPLEEPFGTEENNQRVINYEIPYINKIELTKLKYKVCIGNDSITKIKISDIQAVGGELKHTISDGVFKLTNLCYEGGIRLINPDGSMAIKMIKPNPNSESFEIDFEIRENSKTVMQLYTIQGKLINTFFDEFLLQGKYSKTFDIKSIEAGEYMILLKSGIDQDSYKMIKIK